LAPRPQVHFIQTVPRRGSASHPTGTFVPGAPDGKTENDRNALALTNELIQSSNVVDIGDRSDQTKTEQEKSIPQAKNILDDKKADGDPKKFVEDILLPKKP
jgi:hypothetical protein